MSASTESQPGFITIPWWRGALTGLLAVACFHLAYTPAQSGVWSLAIFAYAICLTQLARLRTLRQCFYASSALLPSRFG
jgi:hypothetical protein